MREDRYRSRNRIKGNDHESCWQGADIRRPTVRKAQLLLETLDIGPSVFLVDLGPQLREIGQDRHLAIAHLDETAVDRNVEYRPISDVHTSVIRDEGGKERCMTWQEGDLAATERACDDLSRIT